jgi:hypothetical protein
MSASLASFDPIFVRAGWEALPHVAALAEAQGISFRCPCGNGHRLLIWFAGRGVPDEQAPPHRWTAIGTTVVDLTLTPSVDSKCWHGWIVNGMVTS